MKGVDAYLAAWDATAEMVEQGRNWSGHERNVAFLNTRDGRFAGVSALMGFDASADSRGLAVVDWDGDGDQDVWITQRTSPRLRFLRNDNHSRARSIQVHLQSTTGNIHGIGARVELTGTDGTRQIRTLRAGEGYLAQSAQTLHFGLGASGEAQTISVRWPDGSKDIYQPAPDQDRILLSQGSNRVDDYGSRRLGLHLDAGKAPELAEENLKRIIPHAPLHLPPIPYTNMDGKETVLKKDETRHLLVFWATWCQPCIRELATLHQQKDKLQDQGLTILALNVDDMRASTAKRLENVKRMHRRHQWSFELALATRSSMEIADAAREAILGRQWTWSIPCSMMLDADGRLLAVYEGSPKLQQLATDAGTLFRSGSDRHHALPYEGHWYLPHYPPDHLALAEVLEKKQRYGELASCMETMPLPNTSVRKQASQLSRNAGMRSAHLDASLAGRLLDQAIRAMPDQTENLYARGMLHQSTGQLESAMELYEKILVLDPTHLRATAALGWLLATAPEPALRKPSRALALAREAVEKTHAEAPEPLDVLAAAYAINAQFDKAVSTARRALALLPEAQREPSPIQDRLNLYQRGQIFLLESP